MKILVLNSGSSSIKYQVLHMPAGEVVAKGLVEQIGETTGRISQTSVVGDASREAPIVDHGAGLKLVVELLTTGDTAPLARIEDIEAVGHRVVHGGEEFSDPALITDDVIDAIERFSALAPLHNPPNLLGIRVAKSLMPDVPQVAVFDTAFHQSMPPAAYRYALPEALYTEHGVRRYGFHGTSHRYVAAEAARRLGKPADGVNLITCHLGNGASMAAVHMGRSVDTTLGFTPLEGLVMGTRSGDIDPAIVPFMARTLEISADEVERILNKKSGLLGLSGVSNDVRRLTELADEGHAGAKLALEVFTYRVRRYIGAFLAVIGAPTDAIVFTAGIGEHSARVREMACAGLAHLGIELDAEANAAHADVISTPGSAVKVMVIPTNEELAIAQDTLSVARD